MNIEQEIHRLAKAGHSRRHATEILGLSRGRFEAVLELIGPVEWPSIGRTVRHREHYARIKGEFHPARAKNLARARQVRLQACTHEVRGYRGTIPQLVEHFSVPVTASTVRRRIKAGATLEQALFTPPIAPGERRAGGLKKRANGRPGSTPSITALQRIQPHPHQAEAAALGQAAPVSLMRTRSGSDMEGGTLTSPNLVLAFHFCSPCCSGDVP